MFQDTNISLIQFSKCKHGRQCFLLKIWGIQVKQNLYSHRNLNVMFITGFFFCNHQTLETTKCSSPEKWINQLWSIHTMKEHSATERKKVLIHPTIWVNFKCVTLSERSHSQKDTYCITISTCVTS